MNESVLSAVSHILTATREALARLAPALDGIGSAALAEAARVEAVAESLAAGSVRAEGLGGVPELPAAVGAGRQAQFALLSYAATLTDLGMGVQATGLALGNVARSLAEAPAQVQAEPEAQPIPAEAVAYPAAGELLVGGEPCRVCGRPCPPDRGEHRFCPDCLEDYDAAGSLELPEEEDGTAYEAPLAAHANPPADPAPEPPLSPKKKARKRKG